MPERPPHQTTPQPTTDRTTKPLPPLNQPRSYRPNLQVLAAVIPEHSATIGRDGVVFRAVLAPTSCARPYGRSGALSSHSAATCPVVETVETGVVTAGAAVIGVLLDFKLNASLLRTGEYAVTVAAVSATNKSQTLGAVGVHNVTKLPASAPPLTVRVDELRRLVVNGSPHFPIGMYASNLNESDYAKFGATGVYNMLMPYNAPTSSELDWAAKHGMQVAYSIKDDFCGHVLRCNSSAVEEAIVKAKLTAYRNHSALLLWYTNDELGLDYLPQLEAHQRWAEELDDNHPTWSVIYQVENTRGYLRTADIQGSDPYPVDLVLDFDLFSLRISAHFLRQAVHHATPCDLPTGALGSRMLIGACDDVIANLFFLFFFLRCPLQVPD